MLEWQAEAALTAEGTLTLTGPMLEGSPVDLLMGAIAGCFAKSCHMVQAARGEATTDLRCTITGRKADDPPNRVGHVRIAYALPDLSADQAAKIAKDAKRICTVTNAMSCSFELVAL